LGQLIRNLIAEPLLAGEALRVQAGDAGAFGDANQLCFRQIAHPRASADYWKDTMLAGQ
jgi:hypothetical protein